MKLKRWTIVLLLVALICGGGAALGARNYIARVIADYRAQLESEYEAVKVVVTANDLPAGATVDSANLVFRDVPKAYLHRDVIPAAQWKQYSGRLARASLSAGAPLLTSQLLDPGSDAFAQVLEPGKRALTVPVDQISSISGLLSPGDRVDVLFTLSGKSIEQTFPLLKDIRVLATGFTTEDAIELTNLAVKAPQRFTTVTLLVSPEEAARITHARSVGSLNVVLRADGDHSDGWPDRVTLTSLLGIEPEPVKPRVRPARVEIIRGGI